MASNEEKTDLREQSSLKTNIIWTVVVIGLLIVAGFAIGIF